MDDTTEDEATQCIPTEHGSSDVEIEAAERENSSNNVVSVDPFSPRKGKMLTWEHVSMTLNETKKSEPRKLLDDVWGEVPPQETCAIMGPSGAGRFIRPSRF